MSPSLVLTSGLCHAGLLIVPTCQHSKMDLVRTGEAVEEEKDALLEKELPGHAVLMMQSRCPDSSLNV